MSVRPAFAGPQVQVVRLAHETDFDGWRAAARRLRGEGVEPEAVLWTVDGGGPGAPGRRAGEGADGGAGFTVPKAFVDLAGQAILHRSDERFSLLYRLVFRLQGAPDLLRDRADPDVRRAQALAADVARAAHRMKAFLRLVPVRDAAGEAQVGWFEPAHRVTEAVAPFFVRRFGRARFSILTPDVCVHWNGAALALAPGIDPADAPGAGGLAACWRASRAAAGGNPCAGRPIPEPTPEAVPMVRATPAEPDPRAVRAAVRASRDAPFDGHPPATLQEVAAGVDRCRRCDLWRNATQGVAGAGPGHARLMFVGEQPGDQEDLQGQPFVGPAGRMLDKALAEAGVPRSQTYVTNAVKHFKHEPRGKRRIHKTPDAGEVAACRWWLEAERRIVRPRVVVALGATAALSVFGKPTPIGKLRQQAIQLPDQAQGVVTYHPSYLLRVPDAEAKAKAYAAFLEDLKFAWGLAA